ncbi:transmembrane protein 179B [Scleropages formosus]|uniref:Transmembrane protein 179Ba n=1 Tax=Scleropages formosus TaxID=113540 RepID=A0A8C9R8Q6_SCLFO|nr:transmembrane protein 179B-like [Scleropages formosus]
MALPWSLLAELVLHAACFVCGVVTAAALTVVQGEFGGRCVLYGTVSYNGTTQSLVLDGSSSPSLCYFVSVVSVCVAIYCFSVTLYWVYLSCVGDEVTRARIWMTASLVVCGVFLFFLLVSGCVLKIGRDHLCNSIIEKASLKSCEEAQNKTWVSPLKRVQFYSGLRNAETSVWVNFFFWIIIVAMVIIQKRQGTELLAAPGDNAGGFPSETEPILRRSGRPQ